MQIDRETYEEIRDKWLRASAETRAAITPARFVEIALQQRTLEEELGRPRREALIALAVEFAKGCTAAGIEIVPDEEDHETDDAAEDTADKPRP